MPVSGNIGDSVQFEITEGTAVTGVKFGSGQANFNKISPTLLDAIVPQTASYGKVFFQEQVSVQSYDLTATGNGDAAAYAALTGQINSLGYYNSASGCSTGEVTFSENNSTSGVCVISTSGASSVTASGVMTDAHSSGFCGGPDSFTSGSYTVSQTRLSGITINQLAGSDNYIAIAVVEYTGDLGVKKAATTVTCNVSGIQSETADKFVPVSRVNSFSVTHSGGGDINIFGNSLSSITGVNLGTGLSLDFTGVSNTLINANVPTGEYEDFLYFDLYSGLTTISNTKYITSGEVSGSDKSQALFIFPNQKFTALKGDTGNAIIRGSGLNDLNSVKFKSEQSVEVTPSTFSSTSGQLTASINGLGSGFHDIIVNKSGASVTGERIIQILDNVQHSYNYETFMSSGVKYLGEHTSGELKNILLAQSYGFETAEDASRISLEFSGNSINGGGVAFNLSKKADISQNVISTYTIKGYGKTEPLYVTNAYYKFNNGIYSEGLYGPYNPNTSYKINPRICDVQSQSSTSTTQYKTFSSVGTYTGDVVGDPLSLSLIAELRNNNLSEWYAYTGNQDLSCAILSDTGVNSGVIGTTEPGTSATVSVSGYSAIGNMDTINAMTGSTGAYSGYSLVSTSTGIIDNFESYSYSSGITYPINSDKLEGNTDQIWNNLHYSGMQELYPFGWGGEHSLTSGFLVVTGSVTGSTSITHRGKSIEAVNNLISGEIEDSRKYCSTGDPAYYNTGEIANLSETSYFWGYC